jgi:rhodanese-related sulfurtransferase
MKQDTISAAALYELHQAGKPLKLIDVRTPVEFREAHVPFAKNIPLGTLNVDVLRSVTNGAPVYLICRTGQRAANACESLAKSGLENVVLVEGGTQGWIKSGLDVHRGKKAISLERQVRIAAGTLVAICALLAVFANPYFALGAAFVGAGLVFSGVTDTCGMGLLLARMPWNQVKTGSPQCSV